MSSSSRYVADFNVAGMRYWDGAIYRKDVKLGYIPRDQNDLAAQLLRFGHDGVLECRILKVDKKAETWNQVRVGLYMTGKVKGD